MAFVLGFPYCLRDRPARARRRREGARSYECVSLAKEIVDLCGGRVVLRRRHLIAAAQQRGRLRDRMLRHATGERDGEDEEERAHWVSLFFGGGRPPS